MPLGKYKTCKVCGGHESEVGPISHTRLCRRDAMVREEENYDALKSRSGPLFRHWRARTAASVGAVLVDDLTTGT